MTQTARPLAKALHTVTAVARVARYMTATTRGPIGSSPAMTAERLTRDALHVLGYEAGQIDEAGELFAACVKAVRAA